MAQFGIYQKWDGRKRTKNVIQRPKMSDRDGCVRELWFVLVIISLIAATKSTQMEKNIKVLVVRSRRKHTSNATERLKMSRCGDYVATHDGKINL